jgi:hypothetical protein
MAQEKAVGRSAAEGRCAHIRCRNTLPVQRTGRPARFCSTRCRQADHRGRRDAAAAAGRVETGDRQLRQLHEETVRALDGIVGLARADAVAGWRSPDAARQAAHALLERLEQAADRLRADRRTAAAYEAHVPPSPAP